MMYLAYISEGLRVHPSPLKFHPFTPGITFNSHLTESRVSFPSTPHDRAFPPFLLHYPADSENHPSVPLAPLAISFGSLRNSEDRSNLLEGKGVGPSYISALCPHHFANNINPPSVTLAAPFGPPRRFFLHHIVYASLLSPQGT